jgi:HSP20 family protein
MFDTMIARDIRQTLEAFRQSVERLFSEAAAYPSEEAKPGTRNLFTPGVESYFSADELTLRVILPAVGEKDLKVLTQNGRLVVEGERKLPEGWPETASTRLVYGRFQVAIPLPSGLHLESVSCRLHDGVLDVHVPLAEGLKPRQIPVESGKPVSISAAV